MSRKSVWLVDFEVEVDGECCHVFGYRRVVIKM